MNVANMTKPNTPAAAPAPLAAARPRHMSLTKIKRGRIDMPIRALLYGMEGVGKSTFAAGAPSPIFLGLEGGTTRLDIARLPEPRSWDEAIEGLALLEHEEHEFKSVVIDTVNWLEPLAWLKVTGGKYSIEEHLKGFGKGYTAAIDHWRVLVAHLERLWSVKKMHIILLGHAQEKSFNDPLGPSYSRYEVAMNGKAAGLLKQWVDFVLFAREEAFAKINDDKQVKGRSTGARFVHTQWNAAYDAKSRGWLPKQIPLSWNEFIVAANQAPDRKEEFIKAIDAGLAELADAEVEEKVRGYLKDSRVDVAEVANAVSAKVQKKREQLAEQAEGQG